MLQQFFKGYWSNPVPLLECANKCTNRRRGWRRFLFALIFLKAIIILDLSYKFEMTVLCNSNKIVKHFAFLTNTNEHIPLPIEWNWVEEIFFMIFSSFLFCLEVWQMILPTIIAFEECLATIIYMVNHVFQLKRSTPAMYLFLFN